MPHLGNVLAYEIRELIAMLGKTWPHCCKLDMLITHRVNNEYEPDPQIAMGEPLEAGESSRG